MDVKDRIYVPAGPSEAQVNQRSGFSSENDDMADIKQSNNLSSPRENEMMLLTSCETIPSVSNMYAQEQDQCQASKGAGKKRIVGWGLRTFSVIVCAKVQAKGRTTYNQVADEIVMELKDAPSDFPFDEKNIRRRVYDAINVLMAINLIEKDKKEIRWIGCPAINKTKELEGLKEVHMNLMNRIQTKANFLRELEEKYIDLQSLMMHNQLMHASGNVSSQGITLPFMLVQTRPQAAVEIEISEDTRFAHFDFNGTPFTLHDDAAVLKAKRRIQAGYDAQSSSDGSAMMNNQSGQFLDSTYFSWSSESF